MSSVNPIDKQSHNLKHPLLNSLVGDRSQERKLTSEQIEINEHNAYNNNAEDYFKKNKGKTAITGSQSSRPYAGKVLKGNKKAIKVRSSRDRRDKERKIANEALNEILDENESSLDEMMFMPKNTSQYTMKSIEGIIPAVAGKSVHNETQKLDLARQFIKADNLKSKSKQDAGKKIETLSSKSAAGFSVQTGPMSEASDQSHQLGIVSYIELGKKKQNEIQMPISKENSKSVIVSVNKFKQFIAAGSIHKANEVQEDSFASAAPTVTKKIVSKGE